MIKTVGSVCSGIEAASVAWGHLGFKFEWFSEIADFPSRLLKEKYPNVKNLGDMANIPDMIIKGGLIAPDLICGGTPCQAFSLAGWKNGLNDDRGNLAMKFVDIAEASDITRAKNGTKPSIVFWENVEGVLTDKTNAFGCLVSSLAGIDKIPDVKRWANAGLLRGPKRNVAWRVLDSKFFGLPQQRRRLYVLAGGKNFSPESVLFEKKSHNLAEIKQYSLTFEKNGHTFEVFREYTDCLYSAYGTKWNGNAAAYNGSLYVVQDSRIRRLSPLECERLMGFPDDYTNLKGANRTNRYQAIGNSWAVPVVRWIGERLHSYSGDLLNLVTETHDGIFFDLGKDAKSRYINCSATPASCKFASMEDIISADVPTEIYLTPVGCQGIVRRKKERRLSMNPRLEEILTKTASCMPADEIEKRSGVQKRGRFSITQSRENENVFQLNLFLT